jgi:hypothetical protein
VFLISRRIDEGNSPFSGAASNLLKRLFFPFQLLPVSLFELFPPRYIVAVPFAQPRAWRYFFRPQLNNGLFLTDASRPEPLNQYPKPILFGWFFVGAFQLNHQKTLAAAVLIAALQALFALFVRFCENCLFQRPTLQTCHRISSESAIAQHVENGGYFSFGSSIVASPEMLYMTGSSGAAFDGPVVNER